MKELVDQAQNHTIVAEMSHYIRLSKTAPLKFEKLKLLVDFVHTVTRD